MNTEEPKQTILVDVIVPVHNAAQTVEVAVRSAMDQRLPLHLQSLYKSYEVTVTVCCYDDGSKDDSWEILQKLRVEFKDLPSTTTRAKESKDAKGRSFESNLLIEKSKDDIGRGAGYARNRAIELHNKTTSKEEMSDLSNLHFLCLLDSDDTMHPYRVAEQLSVMIGLSTQEQHRTLLGCNFDRDPPDSTWHYSAWANNLTDERVSLERFRELTLLQPTWFLSRSRWLELGGYIEAPVIKTSQNENTGSENHIRDFIQQRQAKNQKEGQSDFYQLIHPEYDTVDTLKLAEDLRFFHAHLHFDGLLKLHRTKIDNDSSEDTFQPLVTYRHTGTSQSFRTSRKLLLQLRVLAFERSILSTHPKWKVISQCTGANDDKHNDNGQFVIWSAGRDGKDFVKALLASVEDAEAMKKRIYCFVDIDAKKLGSGSYVNRDLGVNIPIIHYSFLARDPKIQQQIQNECIAESTNDRIRGNIDKSKKSQISTTKELEDKSQPHKRQKIAPTSKPFNSRGLCQDKLRRLPVVVCVAMYRTNGVLERNVKMIGREEGIDLWHFS